MNVAQGGGGEGGCRQCGHAALHTVVSAQLQTERK